ncbi:Ig-like domain-containing protein [Reichenbachiella carrageenanivorans]|uniref:Ig-like domain-containing protein n=1 Tax=Reichenbachiella carrageenanivorans TaxID=2979869 RepID=A0ABY6D4F2_9BACT|nr:Ig-like domain-containing protein [Reichenbachiella carrageenanivorans]UXX81029.1 Ig-like domain-containing protein [Reichenbachiella carrageenanivorans]
MKKIYYLSCFLMMSFSVIAQDWQSLNPGAGGRVQGLSCDPSVPGRMFVASDMEGFYYSSDYGTSWTWAAQDLPTAFMLMAVGHGNKFYVGHAKGLSVSTNKGATYTTVADTEDKTIGLIEIDPSNANYVYAGNNWRGNDGHLNHYPQQTTDTKEIYYSHNGGATWSKSSWDNYSSGDPQVQSITVDPTNSNDVLIATEDGLYRSTNKGVSWSHQTGPSGIDNTYCWGADLSVDGNWLYALYRKGGRTNLFVKNYPNGAWQDLGSGSWDSHNMWQPEVFQASGNSHYVLIGQRDQNPNEGLFEGRFTVSGNTVSGSYQMIMNHNGTTNNVNYDIGWNYYVANCRNNTYYPASWSGTGYTRGVFTQAQQSYFTGDAALGNSDWRIVSTGYVRSDDGLDFFRSRGTASTFTYDVAVHDNYMIQGQADNLALESWDHGGSWVQSRTSFGVQDGHAVHVLPTSPPTVLMDAASGFGGGNPAANSNLLYKTLDLNTPDHNWQQLASANNRKGLPNNRIWQFREDPNDYKRLYVITHAGLYICDDIVSLINTGSPSFRRINSNTSLGTALSFDPDNSNIVYYKDNSGTHKGTRSGTTYTWVTMTRSSGQTNNLHWGGVAVVKSGANSFVYTYERFKGIVRASSGATQFESSAVLWDADLFNYLDEPAWYDAAEHGINTNGILVDGNVMYIPYHVWEDVRWGYGVVKGTVSSNGSVSWENWTSDLHYSTAKQIKLYDGKVYLATQGAGVLARKTNGGQADDLPSIDESGWTPPAAEPRYNLFTDTDETSGLAWSGFGNVTSSPSSGQVLEGASSRYVQGLDQSVAPGADHSLIIEFDPLEVTGGTLVLKGFGIGGALNSLNVKLLDANGGYVDYPNQSFPSNNWGTIAVAISGGTLDTDSFNRVLIERWGGGVDKLYLDDLHISGGVVNAGSSTTVYVTGVTLTPASVALMTGSTQQLSASVAPSHATNQNVNYTSNNTNVVTVNGAGLVTAIAAGTAIVTVTTVEGAKTDQATITVSPVGNGDCSATSSGGKPNPPCQVWTEVTSPTSVILHWNDNSNNEDFFDIMAQLSGDTWRASSMPDGAENASSVSITGLDYGASYKFRIKSKNGIGASAWVETDQVSLGAGIRYRTDGSYEKSWVAPMLIYPVPATSWMVVESAVSGHAVIRDISGKVVYSFLSNKGVNRLDVSGYQNGTYLLEINQDVKRFLVTH